jgi:hypothetical protein
VVRDLFAGSALDSVQLAVDGRALSASSNQNGEYAIGGLPLDSSFTIVATRSNYCATRNEPILISSGAVVATLYLPSAADIRAEYVLASITQSAGTGTVIVDLRNNIGQPRAGIPMADIHLASGGTPVGIGPCALGAGGVIDPSLTTTTAFGGHARVVFLNVPPGALNLAAQDGSTLLSATLLATNGGCSLIAL